MIQVSTASAPRVSKSWATAVSRSRFRATSMKWRLGAASLRMVAMAMLEVAPNTNNREGKSGSRSGTAAYPLPEVGAERGIDVGRPLLPLGIKVLEVGRAHAGILGRIDAAAEFGGDVRKPVHQGEAHLATDRKIECQGDAGDGKRHDPGRDGVAEDLDDGEKRPQSGCGNRLQQLSHSH